MSNPAIQSKSDGVNQIITRLSFFFLENKKGNGKKQNATHAAFLNWSIERSLISISIIAKIREDK